MNKLEAPWAAIHSQISTSPTAVKVEVREGGVGGLAEARVVAPLVTPPPEHTRERRRRKASAVPTAARPPRNSTRGRRIAESKDALGQGMQVLTPPPPPPE